MIDDYIKRWVIKAINDFKIAEHELNQPNDEMITDALCFHCQQAVDEFYMPSVTEAKECFDIASKAKNFLLNKLEI